MSRRKRSYTAAFKLKVVEHAEKKSKNDASKVLLVDRKRVQDWCKQKEDLMTAGRSSKRLWRWTKATVRSNGANPFFSKQAGSQALSY